jgi:hypothetical protein
MRRETCTPESHRTETNVDDDLLKVAKRKVRPDSELGQSLGHAFTMLTLPLGSDGSLVRASCNLHR